MKHIWIYLLGIILMVSCNDPYKNSTYQVYDVNPISTYLDSRPQDFSEWVAILHKADLYNALNQAEELFTAFVPNNEAVREYLQRKDIPSVAEMNVNYARDLVFYHTINEAILNTEIIEGGKLSQPTVSGDYLTVSFAEEGGMNAIYVNNEARILEFAEDSIVSNGYVYVLESMLTPLLETLYDRLGEHDKYSILREAIEATGWQKRLNTPYDTTLNLDGSRDIVKRNFTLLAVENNVYAQSNINSLDDLKNRLNAGSDYTSESNALYKYVGYHIIQQTYYPEDLFSFEEDNPINVWDTQAEGQVISTNDVDGTYYINYNYDTESGVRLIEQDLEDIITARNGIILEVDNYMPLFEPKPVTIMWDLCSYEDVANFVNKWGEENGKGNNLYQHSLSGEERIYFTDNPSAIKCYTWTANSTSSTKWPPIGYLVTRTTDDGLTNTYNSAYKHNFLVLNLGYQGRVSMQSPTIIKGKYKVEIYYGYGSTLKDFRNGGSTCQFSFDNTSTTANIYETVHEDKTGVYPITLWEEIDFSTTSSHEFRVILMDARASTNGDYRLQLDYVKFTPIN